MRTNPIYGTRRPRAVPMDVALDLQRQAQDAQRQVAALRAELLRERDARQAAEAELAASTAEAPEPAAPEPVEPAEPRIARLQADLANVRRHQTELVEQARAQGLERGLLALADVVDDVVRAQRNVTIDSPVAAGLRQLEARTRQQLVRAGAEVIGTVGEAFDPHRHEAIGTLPGGEPGSIRQVEQVGVAIGGKVRRPARVIVGA